MASPLTFDVKVLPVLAKVSVLFLMILRLNVCNYSCIDVSYSSYDFQKYWISEYLFKYRLTDRPVGGAIFETRSHGVEIIDKI